MSCSQLNILPSARGGTLMARYRNEWRCSLSGATVRPGLAACARFAVGGR